MIKDLTAAASFLLLFAASILTLHAQPGCPHTSPDQLLQRFTHVFVGKIVEEKPVEGKYGRFYVRVLEDFKGMGDEASAVVYKYFDGCPDDFKIGETYLIVANKDEDGYLQAWSYAGEPGWSNQREYTEILRWKKSAPGTGLIVGRVVTERYRPIFERQKPFNLHKVFLQDERGTVVETGIEEDGHYKFDNLRPGRYTVFLDLPKGLKMRSERKPRIEGFEVTAEGSFPLNFILLFDNSISGRVTNWNDEPLESMSVRLFASEISGEEKEITSVTTDKDGRYEFKELMPGSYKLLTYPVLVRDSQYGKQTVFDVNSENSPAYFSNGSPEGIAQEIDLDAGEVIDTADISVRNLSKRLIRGRVLYPDGRPAENVDIAFYLIRKPNPNLILVNDEPVIAAKTDARGDFSFYGFENTKYKIQALSRVPISPWNSLLNSDCEELPSDKEVTSLELHLEYAATGCDKYSYKYPF